MLVILNLTAPPVLILLLPAAALGNYALPAPPLSEIAAVGPGGVALPTWVLNNTLYILQGGDPATAIYVPRYENSSGLYVVQLTGGDVIVQIPPGIMIDSISATPQRWEVNKSGIYLYVKGPLVVKYYPFTLTTARPPAATSPTTSSPVPSTTPAPATTTTQTTGTATTTVQQPSPDFGLIALGVIIVVVAILAVFFARRGRSASSGQAPPLGNCGDLNEVDLSIIRALKNAGGLADRAQLQTALGMPKTTLHRHLHKLARYGYVRLVQEGGRQKVELLRDC